MDEQARRQTTKGIWMSRAVEDTKPGPRAMGNNILVMDVEGTDGRERGEDQDFERKSALFALATSEVLVSFSSFYLLVGISRCSVAEVHCFKSLWRGFNFYLLTLGYLDCQHLGTSSRFVPGRQHGFTQNCF